jgi:acyl-CoA hydrolase
MSTAYNLIRTPAYPWLIDDNGFMQAGHVLKLIDILGSEAALKHLNTHAAQPGLVVTASLDRTNFYQPVLLWEMLSMESRVSQVWKRSLETEVTVRAENILTGESKAVATAYLVFVALDAKTREKKDFPAYEPITEPLKSLALAADSRKQHRLTEGKSFPFIPIESEDNPVVITKLMTAHEANAQSNVFGGIILSLIDEAGQKVAQRQALNQPIVGVCLDRMSFLAPTFLGETVEVKAILTKTWHSSMEVQVEVSAMNPNNPLPRRVATSCLVYVRLGTNRLPAEIPAWVPVTESQQLRAEQADRRRDIRQSKEL